MYQPVLSFLTGTLLLGVTATALAGQPAMGTSPADKAPDVIVKQATEDEALAHKMMGHINLAQVAIDLKLPDEAKQQITRARSIEETLAARLPELRINSSFDYGKVTYNDEDVVTDHYIPVIDDVFLVSDYSTIYKHSKAMDIEQKSAGVMHLSVALDLREVRTKLEQAQTAMNNMDYETAREDLATVFRNAVVNEEEVDDPKLLIAENLALAKAFVDDEQYDSARLTLDHVKDRLNRAREDKVEGFDKASIDKFSTELDEMRADLRKKDPSLMARVSARLSNWGDKISGWFS